jgi:hypothetical protein
VTPSTCIKNILATFVSLARGAAGTKASTTKATLNPSPAGAAYVTTRRLLDPDEALRRLETRLGPLHAQLRLVGENGWLLSLK